MPMMKCWLKLLIWIEKKGNVQLCSNFAPAAWIFMWFKCDLIAYIAIIETKQWNFKKVKKVGDLTQDHQFV